MLDRPIIILGAARSGTTLLGDILAHHPDVAYWVEPKYVWRYGNPTARTDQRRAEEATPAVKRYIRSKFTSFVARREGDRFMEKTPTNCFRVPFIQEVFPDARFVHLIRDGRDVAFSARKKWTSPPKKEALWRRLTTLEIPLRDAPFYAVDFLRDVIGRQLRPDQGYLWGPHVEGLRAIRGRHGVLYACAVQWKESVRAALDGLAAVPPSQQCVVRFESLVTEPRDDLGRLLRFLGLPRDDAVIAHAVETVDAAAAARWQQRSAQELAPIHPVLEDMLHQLDYHAGSAGETSEGARPNNMAG